MKNTISGRIGRVIRLIVGSITIVAIFFFGTLFTLDYFNLKYPDSIRASQAKSLKAALEQYRSAHGIYPSPKQNIQIVDLKKDLVDGGYLDAIPADPVSKDNYYPRYFSLGKTYGLLVQLQNSTGKIPPGGVCLTGVGTADTGWWGQPPDCPF